jgi:hypothetical protein
LLSLLLASLSHVTQIDTSKLTENVGEALVHLHDLHKHLRVRDAKII